MTCNACLTAAEEQHKCQACKQKQPQCGGWTVNLPPGGNGCWLHGPLPNPPLGYSALWFSALSEGPCFWKMLHGQQSWALKTPNCSPVQDPHSANRIFTKPTV